MRVEARDAGGPGVERLSASQGSTDAVGVGEGVAGARAVEALNRLADLRGGDKGTYVIVGKDVVRREYRVLVKDIRGRELGVTRWPFDEAAQEAEPREDVSLSALRNETPLALWTKEMHEHWDEQLRGADYAEQEHLRDGPDADLAERLRSGVESPRGAGQNLEAWGCLREPATQQAREEPSASSGSVKPDGPTQTAGAGAPFFPGRTAPLGREASQMRTREPQLTESSGSRQDWRGAGSDVWEGTLAEEWDAPHCPLRIREGGLVCLREPRTGRRAW